MDNEKLNKFLDLGIAWLENQLAEPTLEYQVSEQIKQNIFDLGTKEVFDKLGKGERPALDSFINRDKARITDLTVKALEKVADQQYTADVNEQARLSKLVSLREDLKEMQRRRDEDNCRRIEKQIAELEAKNE